MHVTQTALQGLRGSEARGATRQAGTGTCGITRRLWVEPSLTRKSPKGRENQLILSCQHKNLMVEEKDANVFKDPNSRRT